MAKITFITQENETIVAEGDSGSVMELAVENDVDGIDGNCGGVCSCATCHVHVAPEYFEKTGEIEEFEKDMLELNDNVTEHSRLSCQIEISEELDGMELRVAT
ncbi:MAG: 2Fe-2S ferredoxin [Calditrichaeota bacterium]|nr:MAG: 2Fe-2S ferredoxin [Calditrichota bacterium]